MVCYLRDMTKGNSKEFYESIIVDLKDQKFGRLTVLNRTDDRYHGQIIWECKCDCGNIAYVSGSSLKRGTTKSCGCYQKEVAKVSIRIAANKKNEQLRLKREQYKQIPKPVFKKELRFVVGKNIQMYLTENDMSPKELSYLLGYNNSGQIGVWIRGEANIQIDTLEKIAWGLGVKVIDLVEDWSDE